MLRTTGTFGASGFGRTRFGGYQPGMEDAALVNDLYRLELWDGDNNMAQNIFFGWLLLATDAEAVHIQFPRGCHKNAMKKL